MLQFLDLVDCKIVFNSDLCLPIHVSELAFDSLKLLLKECDLDKDSSDVVKKKLLECLNKRESETGPSNDTQLLCKELSDEILYLKDRGCFRSKPTGKHKPFSEEVLPTVTAYTLMLTNDCTLNCIYCFGKDDFDLHNSGLRMTNKVITSSIDFGLAHLGQEKQLYFQFFGGEPLLEFDLLKAGVSYALKRCNELNINVGFGITTNGTFSSSEIWTFLKKYNFSVTLSVDGPKEIQEIVRPQNHRRYSQNEYQKFPEKLIKIVKTISGECCIRATITNHWIGKTEEILNYYQELGVKRLASSWADTDAFMYGEKKVLGFDFDESNWDDIVTIEDRLANMARSFYKGTTSVKNISYHMIIEKLLKTQSTASGCGAGFGSLTIDSDGKVYPCYRMINSGDQLCFGDIQNGVDLHKRRAYIEKVWNDQLEPCNDCAIINLCAGGCIGNLCHAMDCSTGSRTKTLWCRIMMHRYFNAMKIITDLNQTEIDTHFLQRHDHTLLSI